MRNIAACLLFLLAGGRSVWAGEALWTHQFASESGFPVTLSRPAVTGQNTLVLFWASWCLPCKGELAELAAHPDRIPKNLRIVAVSTDDPSGMPLAQSFLGSIHWPYMFFRDNSGQFFFEYNRSGQLPYSVLLGEDGKEIKSYQKLNLETDLPGMGAPAEANAGKAQRPGGISYGFHSEGVDFSGNNGIHNRMATLNAFSRLDTQNWSAQAQYDYMYEELNNPTAVARGDELGYSFLEYHSEAGPGRTTVRLGDSHEAILAGELLSLQNIPNLLDPASLRGGSAQWDQGDFSLVAYAGTIHPALYASPINPTTDLALPVPGESAKGATLFWHHDLEGLKNQLNLNWVNYHRDVNLGLGYATPINDQRVGAEYYFGSAKSGLQVRAAQFSTNTGIQGIDAEKPYIMDPYFWWSYNQIVYSFHYLEYQSLPARTLTPVLVENPSLPLQAAKIRSFRVSPKITFDSDNVWFEPVWIFEETRDLLPYERQNTYGFNLSLPKRDQKLLMFYQDGLLSPESTYRESSLLATSPIVGPLSVQVLLRRHQADQLSGDSDGFNFGVDLTKWWGLTSKGRWLFSSQWTRQSGYYYGFSGIARTDLVSSHLEWSSGVNTVKLGVGAEPGGIVCTNGVCVQKPPLNGADLEVAFTF